MIYLICKALRRPNLPTPPTIQSTLCCLFSTLQMQSSSNTSLDSVMVDFLRSSCGLSLESALSASKKLENPNLERANAVIDFLRSHGVTQKYIKSAVTNRPGILGCDVEATFKPNIKVFKSLGIAGADLSGIIRREPSLLMVDVKGFVEFFESHGFTKDQIVCLTKRRPTLYLLNPGRNFRPKLEYFKGLGLSSADVAAMLSAKPYALERSLEGHIKPSVELLIRVFGSDAKMLVALKSFSRALEARLDQVLETNISIFLSHGVPECSLLRLFGFQPSPLLIKSERLREVADEAVKMGFDPKQFLFILAIRTLGTMRKSLWNQKLELYKSFGLSEENVLHAFRKQPLFMIVSEDKISKSLGFFINKLKMSPLAVVKSPNLLLISLEKRVIPRCSVLQLLWSKGLVKEKTSLTHLLVQSEKLFVERYVNKFMDQLPEVVNAHQGKFQVVGLDSWPSSSCKKLNAECAVHKVIRGELMPPLITN